MAQAINPETFAEKSAVEYVIGPVGIQDKEYTMSPVETEAGCCSITFSWDAPVDATRYNLMIKASNKRYYNANHLCGHEGH